MQIRKTDDNGDWRFGNGANDFWSDAPDGVAQLVVYRLSMEIQEWWLDLTAGTPWEAQILGHRSEKTRDPIIRARILDTQGVRLIEAGTYSANLDRDTRFMSITAQVTTIYSVGPTQLRANIRNAT